MYVSLYVNVTVNHCKKLAKLLEKERNLKKKNFDELVMSRKIF